MRPYVFGGWLTITRDCQARCDWCYARDSKYNKDIMPVSLVREVCEIIVSTGAESVILIGGEPTMHPDFFEIVRIVRQYGMRPDLITNGFKLASQAFVDQMVKERIGVVSLSLKAPSNHDYQRFTGIRRGYSLVRRAFANCREAQLPLRKVARRGCSYGAGRDL